MAKLEENAKEAGYNLISGATVTTDDQLLGSIKNSRPVIRWAFQNDKGSISEIFECSDKFVVAIAGIGIEPNLNAMVSMAQVDQVSAPVKGNNGVYVFKVYARNKDGKEFNEAEEIRALDASNAYRVGFQAIQSMVNNAKVEDNRIRFY